MHSSWVLFLGGRGEAEGHDLCSTWQRPLSPEQPGSRVYFPSEVNWRRCLGKADLFSLCWGQNLDCIQRPVLLFLLEFLSSEVWVIEWVCGSGCVCLPEKEIRFNNGDLLANTRKSTLSWQITYFSLAVIKLQGSLEKKEFLWTYNSRGRRVKHSRESGRAKNSHL